MNKKLTVRLTVAAFATLAGTVFLAGGSASAAENYSSKSYTNHHQRTMHHTAAYGGRGADAWQSSNGMHAYNKTNGMMLSWMGNYYHAKVGTNVIFTAMHEEAHHYTVRMQDVKTGKWVHYRENVSQWSMMHPRQDRRLGWTVYKPAEYKLEVIAYAHDGTWLGSHMTELHVSY